MTNTISRLDPDLIEAETGYRLMTTFFEDFSIADKYGMAAIKDTYQRIFREWKHQYKYVTELTLILNWKIWEHESAKNHDVAKLYNDLWIETDNWAMNNLKGDELTYFYRIND